MPANILLANQIHSPREY